MAHVILRLCSSRFAKIASHPSKNFKCSVKPTVLGGVRNFLHDSGTGFWDIQGSTAVNPNQTANRKNIPSNTVERLNEEQTENMEPDFVRVTKFGHIRLDTENAIKEPCKNQTVDPTESFNYVDQQFFGNQNLNIQLEQDTTIPNACEIPSDTNDVDSQYFYPNVYENRDTADTRSVTSSDLKFEENTIDQEYFGKVNSVSTPVKEKSISALQYLQSTKNQTKPVDSYSDKKTAKFATDNMEDPNKSYQNLIPNFKNLPIDVICSILKKSIIYNEGGIVAINKPFGMVTTDVDKKAKLILTDFLPSLSKLLHYDQLHTVHRLDRDTTGVLLLASNQEMANKLNKLFFNKEIKKKYVAITKGIPNPKEGTIDIPISETVIMNRQRMKLRPVQPYSPTQSSSYNYRGKSSKAVTHYKVIQYKGSGALVQLEPETGVRHQIRVHLSEAIQCPILGDHKYSHSDKYAPQKLPDDLLKNLTILPSKTRTIPMHLHAETIQIPHLGPDGKDLVIRASLPQHFRHTLKKLKMSSKMK